MAQQQKQQRYPCTNGISVTTCAAEVFGRISLEFEDFLEQLASMAFQSDLSRCRPRVGWKRKWLTQISVLLAKRAAQTLCEAGGALQSSPLGGQHAFNSDPHDFVNADVVDAHGEGDAHTGTSCVRPCS